MTVGFSGTTLTNTSNSNVQQKKVQFGIKEKVSQKKQEFSTAMKDNDKRYNIIGAITGLLILGAIGIGIMNNNKVFKSFEKKKLALKKYLSPETVTFDLSKTPHGGPDVDFTKGPTAIHDAWTKYIKNIKNNRKNNAKIFQYYKELFAERADKLDELEALAKERVLKRGGTWA